MTREEFIDSCKTQLTEVYQNTKAGTPDNVKKYRTEGFIHAGQVIGLISRDDARQIIESTHLVVFGESVSQRKDRKASFEELKENSPDEYYEIPAIERKR